MMKNHILRIIIASFSLLLLSGCYSYSDVYDEGYKAAMDEFYDSRFESGYEEGYKEGYNEAKSELQGFFFSAMDEDGTLSAFWDKWYDDINELELEY